MKGFNVAIGDTVNVTLDRYGFTNKNFEVAEWNVTVVGEDQSLGVELTLRETNPAVYDWSAEEQTFIDNSTLPDIFNVPAPTLSVTDVVQTFQQGAITTLHWQQYHQQAHMQMFLRLRQNNNKTQIIFH